MEASDVELTCPHCLKRFIHSFGTFSRHKNACVASKGTPSKKKQRLDGEAVLELNASEINSQVVFLFCFCLRVTTFFIHLFH
jgi:hypothetical protein